MTPTKKFSAISVILLAALVFYLFFAGHVSKSITAADVDAIEKLSVQTSCAQVSSFPDEIACVKAIQLSIRALIPNNRCAGRGTTIEPLDFITRSFGCCYDRARFTEKALIYYGFETRHVAIYDVSKHGLLGFFIPGISSHATSEVLTTKGWMGVDSNEPFILLTKNKEVLTFRNFKKHADDLDDIVAPQSFYANDLMIIYGLFSRHGMFHGLNLPAPEFNFRELRHNF